MDSCRKAFSERLRQLRGGQNQTRFAETLGIPQTTYSNFERGVREPGLELLAKISTHYGVSVDWLLGLSETISSPHVTATHGSAAAVNGSTATVSSAPSAETARLLALVESQQAVIAKLSGASQLPWANHPVITEGETGISKAGPPTVNDTKSWRPKCW